ncbi:hypothetical protein BS47DRAFT_969243 [Hydnum rufescens UP504]|uniref:Uncharacterized protein n=1 Tax=Hydnum rufescens UP504 TaxID=1448309 RepID=A0A9P6AX62_9AGAM|nr:hypothetical protein BS47DRAFT_969243 [Hydnum rufescens UP504]
MSSATVSPSPLSRASHEEHLHASKRFGGDRSSSSNGSSSRVHLARTHDTAQEQPLALPHTRSRSGSKSKSRPRPRPDALSPIPKKGERPAFLAVYGATSEREGQGSSSYSSSYSSSTDTPAAPLPPPSPHLPYFDKYPKRSERLKPPHTINDDRDESNVSRRSRSSLKAQRPATAPVPRASSESRFVRSRLKEQEKLRGSQEEGAVYAWPPKTSASTRSRHPHASSSTKAHIVTPSSASSSTPSSPSSSPEALPPRPLPPLIPNSPYGHHGGNGKSSSSDAPGRGSFTGESPSPEDSLVVASGFDVSNMDALVEQMNSSNRESIDMSLFSSSEWTFTKPRRLEFTHHPLYHPPVPSLPP